MTDIDPGNPYSPHKSWNNRTEREELIEIIENYLKNKVTHYNITNSFGDNETKEFDSGCHVEITGLADAILERHKKGLVEELETAQAKESLNIYHNGGFTVKLEWIEHRIAELKED